MRCVKGFTLLEILFYCIVLIILVSTSVPLFLHMREQVRKEEAVSNLRVILAAQRAYYIERKQFLALSPTGAGAKAENWAALGIKNFNAVVPPIFEYSFSGGATLPANNCGRAVRADGPFAKRSIFIDADGTIDYSKWD
ncbi:MAG: type II secretion system GspH family protein [Candidatus Omnitrophica bacterium]|nr:type II secretion system GspH family protein [Candidatus Omnitrophota bacterium]